MRDEEVGGRGQRLRPRPQHVPVTLQLHVLEIQRLVAQPGGRPRVGDRRERPRLERRAAQRTIVRQIALRRRDVRRQIGDVLQVLHRGAALLELMLLREETPAPTAAVSSRSSPAWADSRGSGRPAGHRASPWRPAPRASGPARSLAASAPPATATGRRPASPAAPAWARSLSRQPNRQAGRTTVCRGRPSEGAVYPAAVTDVSRLSWDRLPTCPTADSGRCREPFQPAAASARAVTGRLEGRPSSSELRTAAAAGRSDASSANNPTATITPNM